MPKYHRGIYCCRTEKIYLKFSLTHDWVVLDFFGFHRHVSRERLREIAATCKWAAMLIPRTIAFILLCLVPYLGLIANLLWSK